MEKTSKIYIAGNTGLAGSAIVRNLKKQGYENLVFTPHPEYDLRNQDTVNRFFEQEQPEYVMIAAAKVGGIWANKTYPAEFIYDNLMIQCNIIHAAYHNQSKKLLFLGSSCIYPKLCPQPIKEEYLLTSSLEPTNEAYALAKISGLKTCAFYRRQYGCDFISAMPTNLYGYGDNFNLETSHVLPAMIRKMHLAKLLMQGRLDAIRRDLKRVPYSKNETDPFRFDDTQLQKLLLSFGIDYKFSNSNTMPNEVVLKIWGSGSPRREFLFSDDLADALIYLMNHYSEESHINVGTGVDQTIKELAYMVKEAVGFQGALDWEHSKPDGTPQKLLDVSRLRHTGWQEKVELAQGIRMVYEWYLQQQ